MRDNFLDGEELFVLDLANNHFGDVEHALEIVRQAGEVVRSQGVRGALKLQFRQLDTFIHDDFKSRNDIKYIDRFQSTRLEKDDFSRIIEEVRAQNLIPMSTPFDEESLAWFRELDIPILKIASCSINDWPLIEAVMRMNLPVIASTGGANLGDIDRVVSYFEMRRVPLALMHCVSVYPTPAEKLKLNQVDLLRKRYPELTVGWSTHEDPSDLDAVKIAYAKGARIFERHVGISTAKYPLNAYSSEPHHLVRWIEALKRAKAMCGGDARAPAYPEEREALDGLGRGIFARCSIRSGEVLTSQNVQFAIPRLDGQLRASDWAVGIVADRHYEKGEAIDEGLAERELADEQLVREILLQVKGMLSQARIFVGEDSAIEISHHYGLRAFREFGAFIITCIDREYCKKLIVQLPRQKHPYHYHEAKEETFQLLYGDAEVEVDGLKHRLEPGDKVLIPPRAWHKFHTLNGAIIEEVTTRNVAGDSIYEDHAIESIPREQRKTRIANWEAALRESSSGKGDFGSG